MSSLPYFIQFLIISFQLNLRPEVKAAPLIAEGRFQTWLRHKVIVGHNTRTRPATRCLAISANIQNTKDFPLPVQLFHRVCYLFSIFYIHSSCSFMKQGKPKKICRICSRNTLHCSYSWLLVFISYINFCSCYSQFKFLFYSQYFVFIF